MIDIILGLALGGLLASLWAVAVLTAPPSPKRPANGGTPTRKGKNLDAPTYTRRQIEEMKDAGFTIVGPDTAPFAELKPMKPANGNSTENIAKALNPTK